MDEAIPNYSISFRLQRTTTEFAFVRVPVTGDLMIEQPGGPRRSMVPRSFSGPSRWAKQPESRGRSMSGRFSRTPSRPHRRVGRGRTDADPGETAGGGA